MDRSGFGQALDELSRLMLMSDDILLSVELWPPIRSIYGRLAFRRFPNDWIANRHMGVKICIFTNIARIWW